MTESVGANLALPVIQHVLWTEPRGCIASTSIHKSLLEI